MKISKVEGSLGTHAQSLTDDQVTIVERIFLSN